MDVTQALKDAENTLRDFIAVRLSHELGPDWIEKCGVSDERIAKWRERKEAEVRRQVSGTVEARLLYYADFYDLKPILKKHWAHFSVALGELKTLEVWLSDLERLRDPDAHRRELMPHQKALAVGISGEIRSRLIRYRSKLETNEDCFPRIECVRDSLGNVSTPPGCSSDTKLVLRPGDLIDYVITAGDPLGQPLQYRALVSTRGSFSPWVEANTYRVKIEPSDVRRSFAVHLFVQSSREYHANDGYDDAHSFLYSVLPSQHGAG